MQNHTLRDGKTIPPIGFGTANMNDVEAEANVAEALLRGYRLIDTAVNYENEVGVGKAINRSSIDREDIFVTTKVPGRDQGYESTKASLRGSLERMNLDYVDLYLIHWPNPSQGRFVDTWRAMIELQEEGLTKSIGVSNFLPEHIDELVEATGVVPAVNQVECHPLYQQEPQREYNLSQAILTQSWAPLGRKTNLLKMDEVTEIAKTLGKSPAQVVLRWHVQNNLLPIPKSSSASRMDENLDVFEWELSDEQMQTLHLLNSGVSGFGFDPREHEEM